MEDALTEPDNCSIMFRCRYWIYLAIGAVSVTNKKYLHSKRLFIFPAVDNPTGSFKQLYF